MNRIPQLDREGVLTEVVRDLVPPLKTPRTTRIVVVACGVKKHFPWEKACTSYDAAVKEIREAVNSDRFEVIRSREPFEDPKEMLAFLDGELSGGIDGIVLYHAAYTAGEIGSQFGRWMLDHQIPLLSWSHADPETGGNIEFNSFCCQNFLLNMFSRLGVKYSWVHADPGPEAHEEIVTFCRSVRARARFRQGKLLHVGGSRVPAFYDGETDELSVMRRFGVRFDRVDLEAIHQRSQKYSDKDLRRLVDALTGHERCKKVDLPDEQIKQTYRFGLAILEIAAGEGYLGCTVKSWPDLFDCYGCAIDGSISMMNDFGLCSAEEGEMHGLLSSLAVYLLSEGEAVPTMMDISGLKEKENRIVLWHTGACPTRIMRSGEGFEARRHSVLENGDPESAVGLNVEFLLQTGPVTVVRYQSPDASRMLSFEGDIVETPMRIRGSYGEVEPRGDHSASQIMGTILSHGLDHHWSFGYGYWNRELRLLNHWLGVQTLPVGVAATDRGISLGEPR